VVLLVVLALAIGSVVAGEWGKLSIELLLTWAVLCPLSNLVPIPAGPTLYLSLNTPVDIAVAFLFPTPVAATLVFATAVSEWELRRDTTISHALFNRGQLALSTAAAAAVLAARPGAVPMPWLVIAAVLAHEAVNGLLVALAEWTSRGMRPAAFARRVLPGGFVAVLTYLTLGSMGLALALAYQRIGTWAVALLMIPLLGARQSVRAAKSLEMAERERRLLADRLIEEREGERLRIASDLHDVVLQDLAGLQMHADNVATAMERRDPEKVSRMVRILREGADLAIADVRQAIRSLRRVSVDEDGLVPTLERFARTFERASGVRVAVRFEGVTDQPIPASVAMLIYECCQEALTNVARHARASTAEVDLVRDQGQLQLRVRDDGTGFSSTSEPGEAGHGLVLTREKVALAGGGYWVQSRPGQGTEVIIRVPTGAAT
jgi:signal transduction histidine kinase